VGFRYQSPPAEDYAACCNTFRSPGGHELRDGGLFAAFPTRLRREGADLADVQALLGHKSPKTTARYAEVSAEKLVTAVQRMERGRNEARETFPERGAVRQS
jgi:integrase